MPTENEGGRLGKLVENCIYGKKWTGYTQKSIIIRDVISFLSEQHLLYTLYYTEYWQ